MTKRASKLPLLAGSGYLVGFQARVGNDIDAISPVFMRPIINITDAVDQILQNPSPPDGGSFESFSLNNAFNTPATVAQEVSQEESST